MSDARLRRVAAVSLVIGAVLGSAGTLVPFAISSDEHPLLVVDLFDEPGRWFRAIASEIWSVTCNLPIANMDWEDFAEAVDKDGVFRGFGR